MQGQLGKKNFTHFFKGEVVEMGLDWKEVLQVHIWTTSNKAIAYGPMQQEYSLQEKNVYKMIVCKKRILYSLQDNSLQEKNTVQLARIQLQLARW